MADDTRTVEGPFKMFPGVNRFSSQWSLFGLPWWVVILIIIIIGLLAGGLLMSKKGFK
jgi:hypothetical protein